MNALTLVYLYVRTYFSSEEGQGLAEYGMIIALVAVAAVAAVTAFGGDLSEFLTGLGGEIFSAEAAPATP
jgi:pilus assembly protein Flp/PilA